MNSTAWPSQGIRFDDDALRLIIREYTYEAGVRNLEREIANVCRKLARREAENKSVPKRITAESLNKYLGPPQFLSTLARKRMRSAWRPAWPGPKPAATSWRSKSR